MDDKSLAMATKSETAVAAATATAIAEIRSCLQLAKMYPRNVDEARVKILDTCKRPGFAPHVQYNKPIGNAKIKGISIRGAEVAANCWGNIKSMSGIIFDDEKKRIIGVVSMDLETNTSYSSQVIVEKVVERSFVKKGQVQIYERINTNNKKVFGVVPTEDEFQVKVAAQISKQIRNNILRIIPEDIKEEMISTANKTMADKFAKDPQGEIKKIVDAFAELRVKPNDLKAYLGHDVGKCSPTQVAELRVIYKTINDGEAVWVDYLSPPKEGSGEGEDGGEKSRTDKLKDDLGGEGEGDGSIPKTVDNVGGQGDEQKTNAASEDPTTKAPAQTTKDSEKETEKGEVGTTVPADKKKEIAAEKKAVKTRKRVSDFFEKNPEKHNHIKNIFMQVLDPKAKIENFLDAKVLATEDFTPDSWIKKMDAAFKKAGFYK